MLKATNPTAAALARLPKTGAKVGPRAAARLPSIGWGPRVPSHTTGIRTKNSEAIPPLNHMAIGWSKAGRFISPMWHAAASKAGAANPIR